MTKRTTRRTWIAGACAVLGAGVLTVGRASAGTRPRLRLRANTGAIESAPILLAARDHFPGGIDVALGGIPNLVGAANIAGVFDAGPADAATHAETQALRYSLQNPEIRIILTATEGLYSIVARRSAGIARIADLRGKAVATLPGTSAAFFLHRMLEQAGVDPADVEAVRVPPQDMSRALAERRVAATAIWEPFSIRSLRALGDDAVTFSDPGTYREMFNLNTTRECLADPVLRGELVELVRSIRKAAAAMASDPGPAMALVARETGFSPADVAAAWPHLRFPAALPKDLIDIMVAQEAWLAAGDGRPARSRAALDALIDRTILCEAERV